MKKLKFLILVIIFLIFSAVLFAEESQDVEEIIDNVEKLFDVETSSSVVKQTITTTRGQEREFKILMQSKDGVEKQYMEYLEPARVEGVKFLYLDDGDEIWTYFPRTGRTRKLAEHRKKRKVMGSEFTYEDMAMGDFKEKYTYELLREEEYEDQYCWVIKLVPTEKGPSYSKELMWARKNDYYPVKIEFYQEEDELLKTMTQSQIKGVEGVPTAFKMVMETEETGAKTIIEILSIEYGVELPDLIFTTEYLGRE